MKIMPQAIRTKLYRNLNLISEKFNFKQMFQKQVLLYKIVNFNKKINQMVLDINQMVRKYNTILQAEQNTQILNKDL